MALDSNAFKRLQALYRLLLGRLWRLGQQPIVLRGRAAITPHARRCRVVARQVGDRARQVGDRARPLAEGVVTRSRAAARQIEVVGRPVALWIIARTQVVGRHIALRGEPVAQFIIAQTRQASQLIASAGGPVRLARSYGCDLEPLPSRLLFSFTPVGGEMPINTVTANPQQDAVVASDSSGAFVVVWQSQMQDGNGWGIYAQLYNSSGVAQGGNFLVNQTTANDQTLPAVAMDSSGNFVVAWMSNTPPKPNIFARVFSANGTALTNELNISNVSPPLMAGDPAVAMDDSGNFVVAYDAKGGPATNQGIYSQTFNSSGAALDSAEFVYEPPAPGPNGMVANQGMQVDPTLAMNDTGNYVVAWTAQGGPQGKIYAQLYAANGTPTGSPFLVGTSGNYQESNATAGMDASGNVTVAWTEQIPGPNGQDILAQQFNASGVALHANPIAVNTYTTDMQQLPSLAELSDGQFVVTWESNNEDGAAQGVYAQVFTASGAEDGGQFQVNTTTMGPQETPHAAWDGSDAVVAWDGQTATDNNGIAAQRFTATTGVNQAPTVHVPAGQSTSEDTALTFSSANGNALTVADPDGGQGTEQVTLTATNGSITLATLSGLSLTTGTGAGDATVTFQGTLSALNAALNGMSFNPTSGFSGTAGLAISIDDLGNTGSGGALTASGSVSIAVAAVAHTPTVTNANTNENQQTTSGLVITPSPSDLGLDYLYITNIAGGTLYLNDGHTAVPNGTFLTSLQAEAGLKFTPTADSTATGTFNVQASTLAGIGGLSGSVVTATITVKPVPVVSTPTAQSVSEEGSLTLSSANSNAIVVSDPGATNGTATVTLAVTGGVVSLANDSLVVLNSGTGINDSSVSFTGPFIALNAALDGMTFTPTAHTYGSGGITVHVTEGSNSASGNAAITVTRVAHTPTVTNASTSENVQSTSGLVVTPSSLDSNLTGYFQVTNINGGSLFLNDGTSQVINNEFITFAQGEAGLKFTPNANSTSTGSFNIQASTTNASAGLGGAVETATITINGVAQISTPAPMSTSEDQPLTLSAGNAISVSDPGNPNATATLTLTATGGTISLARTTHLSLNSGTGANDATVSVTGLLSDINAALNGLVFTPATHTYGGAAIAIHAVEGSNSTTSNLAITVVRVVHTPSVTDATTNENQRTSGGLVITPKSLDSGMAGYFRITGISGGTLYKNDGVSQINDGDFITFAQGEAGLIFAPAANSTATGAFSAQASTTNAPSGLGGAIVTANVTVNGVPQLSVPGSQSTGEDQPLSLAGSNSFTVGDPGNPSGIATVSLNATGGSVTLASRANIAINSGTGANDTSVSFTGSFSALDAALNGLIFTPTTHAYGSADIAITVAEGTNQAGGSVAITVARLAHTPSVTSATTNENQQTTSGLVITPNSLDNGLSGYFQITGITGGTLYQNDGVTPINNGDFITFAQGGAGLAFTPAANFTGVATFDAQASTTNAAGGLGGSKFIASVTVNGVPQLSVPGAMTTPEDQSFTLGGSNAISISDQGAPGATATVTLTAASGHLTLANRANLTIDSGTGVNDTSVTFTGSLSALNSAMNGLLFTPASHAYGSGNIAVSVAEGPNTASGNVPITINRVAHTPTLTSATTDQNQTTTSGLVITPSSLDASLSGYFQITNITGGALFQNDGQTPINDGDFITFAQGEAGLRFTPDTGSTTPGTIAAQASTTATTAGLGGSAVTTNIYINGIPAVSLLGTENIAEDTSLLFSAASQNGISVVDPGHGSNTLQLSLSASNGNLALGTTSGLTLISGADRSQMMSYTGNISAINAALDGLTFTPVTHFTGPASLTVSVADGPNSAVGRVNVNVSRAAHMPSVTSATTLINQQTTSGLVITPSQLDSGLNEYFKITGITGGTLFQSDGVTPIHNGDFITSAQGAAGLTFTPDLTAAGAGAFTVRASLSANDAGLGGAPVSDTITVEAPPVVSVSSQPLVYVEKSAPVALDPSLTLNDSESSTIAGATVQLLGYVPGQDALAFADQNGITGSFDANSGILTLSGVASAAAYRDSLRSITYVNTSDDPTTTARSLQFTVTDGTLASLAVSRPLNVIAVNDPPVVSVPPAQQTLEGEPITLSAGASNPITVSDVDAEGSVEQISLNVTGGAVTLAPQSGVSITAGTGTNDAQVTFTGTLAQLNAAMNGLTFTPAPNFSGTASIAVTANDLGNTGTGGAQSAQATLNIAVIATAHTPSVSNAATVEDSQSSAGLTITPNPLDANLNGFYQITGITGGALFQADGITPVADGQFISFAQGAAGLRFTPTANSTAGGSFTAQAATAADPSTLGGAAATATITVTPLPLAVESAALTAYTPSVAAIDPAALQVLRDNGSTTAVTYQIVQLPQFGTLRLAGADLSAGATFTSDDVASGQLEYVSQNTTSDHDAFTFTAADAEGATTAPRTFSIALRRKEIQPVIPPPHPNTGAAQSTSNSLNSIFSPVTPVDSEPLTSAPVAISITETAPLPTSDDPTQIVVTSAPPGDASTGDGPAGAAGSEAIRGAGHASVAKQADATHAPAGGAVSKNVLSHQAPIQHDQNVRAPSLADIASASTPPPVHHIPLVPGEVIPVLAPKSPMWKELDKMEQKMTTQAPVRVWAGTASFVSFGLPVMYLAYALRAGTLLSSLMSSIPGWRMVDPLPILNEMSNGDNSPLEEGDDEEDKGLNDLMDKEPEEPKN